jgi:hypothetical protein
MIPFPNPTNDIMFAGWTFWTWQQGESKIQKGPSQVLLEKGT